MTGRALKRAALMMLVVVLFYVVSLRTAEERAPRSQTVQDFTDGRLSDPQVKYQAISMGSPELGCWELFWTRMPHDRP